MKTRFAAVAAACAALVTATGQAAMVMSLDASRTGNEGEAGDNRYLTSNSMSDATQILLDAGFAIGTTDRFVSGNIAGADVLYTGAVSVDFTAQELDDIEQFVAGGGGLIVQRDWGSFFPAADPLAAVFGAVYGVDPEGPPAPHEVLMTAASPIWDGPAGSADSYLQQFSASVSFTGGGEIVGEHVGSGRGAIGVTEFGLGRVVFLTDMDAWDSLGDSITPMPGNDNGVVWENAFWYATPAPGVMPLLALALGRAYSSAIVTCVPAASVLQTSWK